MSRQNERSTLEALEEALCNLELSKHQTSVISEEFELFRAQVHDEMNSILVEMVLLPRRYTCM